MRYMLLIYGNGEGADASKGDTAMFEEYGKFTEDIQKRGLLRAGDPLHPTSMATTVRVRNGNTQTTDGPFAETKEQLGGYYIVECKDIDEAIETAAKVPGARFGSIEVRPIMEM